MNRAGWALIKSSWASWMQYRSFFFIIAFGWMVPPLIYLFVWTTAAGDQSLGGMTRGEFIAYYLLLIVINQFTYAQTNWTVGDLIRDGSLNAWLLRPVAFIYQVFASELAGKVVMMAFTLPVAVLLALLLQPELNATAADWLRFVPALALAWWLRFLWGYALALLAFWATRADALLAVQDALVFLLAGVVAPMSMLPTALQSAATFLPFRYMIGFPVEVLGGHLSSADLWLGFAMQTGWLLFSLVASMLIWRSGLRRYAAIGG